MQYLCAHITLTYSHIWAVELNVNVAGCWCSSALKYSLNVQLSEQFCTHRWEKNVFCRFMLMTLLLYAVYMWGIGCCVCNAGAFLGPFHGAIASPLSRVVVVVVVIVDIDVQVACDSTGSDTWWMGMQQLAVANGPNVFQMLLVLDLCLLIHIPHHTTINA